MSESRLERLRQMVAKKPDDPFIRYGLAMEYQKQGRLEKARELFDHLIDNHPEYTATYFHYGLLLSEAGETQRAVDILTRGIQIAGSKGENHARQEMQAALDELHSG